MPRPPHPLRLRRAFTLVELLVVITIIGILASFITVTAMRARITAKNAVTKTEISQLAIAVEAYKEKYGEYPPDLTDDVALLRHLRKAFPRYTGTTAQFRAAVAAAYGATDGTQAGPAAALVIFLGGLPENPGSTKPAGFHANPANPFQTGTPRLPPFYTTFDTDRLTIQNSSGVLLCQYRQRDITTGAPYVYFRSRRLALTNGTASGFYDEFGYVTGSTFAPLTYPMSLTGATDACVPYLASLNGTATDPLSSSGTNPREWRDAGKFQIIAPGMDGLFGSPTSLFRVSRTDDSVYPLSQADFDNLTSFSQGTIEDEMK